MEKWAGARSAGDPRRGPLSAPLAFTPAKKGSAWKSPVQNHVSEYPLSCVQYPRSLSDFILLLFVVVPRWKMAGMSLGDGKREGVEHWLTLFKCFVSSVSFFRVSV